MPRFDGTGPRGKGPLTGRGLGYCIEPLNTKKTVKGNVVNTKKNDTGVFKWKGISNPL